MEQFDSIYWRGQGPLMIATRDTDGSPLGFDFVGDVESVEGAPSVSRHDIKENVSGQRLTAGSFITEQATDITINFKSVKPSHLARALQADLTAKSASSVTDESHKGYLGKFIKLDRVKISSVVVTSDPAGTTYVEDTDYIVHAEEGAIEILSTGSIGDGDSLLIDYAYAAQTELKANPQNQEFILSFMGMNTTNSDKTGRCTIHRVLIDPAFLSLIQQDSEASLSVKCKMLVDTLRSSGDQLYTWDLED